MSITKVFDGQAVDGRSRSVQITRGQVAVILNGDFNGGAVTVDAMDPDGAWVTFDPSVVPEISAPGVYVFDIPPFDSISLNLSGTSSNAVLSVWIVDAEPD